MRTTPLRVALIGPESTGKTTLCAQLAAHFNTLWIPEFARDYISSLQRPYTEEDILHCAKEQLRLEQEASGKANRLLFCDTEMIIAKVWLLDKYKHCPDWIEQEIALHPMDLYLLTAPDVEFEPDAVRENEHRRVFFYEWYKNELEEKTLPYAMIKGKGKDRLAAAQKAVEHLLAKPYRNT